MHEAASSLSAWESFYVIVGSSGAALTGLQFVVMTLVTESPRTKSSPDTTAAFGTPTVVHFCAALLISAVLSAPWNRLSSAGLAISITGAAGVLYVLLVIRRARRQDQYRPVLEDWIWHAVLPVISYGSLLVAALDIRRHPAPALFVIGAVALLLLFIGIHNSWDTVTYIAVQQRQAEKSQP
ncbi:MAG: hypothetical protein ACJ8BF_13225 [Gemmatimonadales bacterium]